MAKLGRAGHCGSPANASGLTRHLWVVWLLVGCVVLSGGSSVPVLEAAPPRDLPPLTDDPCENADVLGMRMIDLAAEIDRLQDARDLALADAEALWSDPQPLEPRTSVDTLDLVSLDPDAEKERVRYLSSAWMDELRQRVKDLNQAGLPTPRGYQDGEEDFWSDFSEATLQEADRRLAKISDPCEAAIDLKLYLESQQSGWTLAEVAERAVTVPYDVVLAWVIPNKWDVLDLTVKLAWKPVPVLGWISTASNVYDSFEAIVKGIGVSAAARRAGWALETYENTQGWSVEEVDRRGREILREIDKSEEDIRDARSRLEREIAALDVKMREIGCWGIEAQAPRCRGAMIDYGYRHKEAQQRFQGELQELMSRLLRKQAEISDLQTYRAPLARGVCPGAAADEQTGPVGGDEAGGPAVDDTGGAEPIETGPDAQTARERLSALQEEYISEGRVIVFHDWIQEKIDTLEAQYREIGEQYLNWTTACSNRVLDLPIGHIVDPGSATIVRADPAKAAGGLGAGQVIASQSGAWKEGPLNHPVPENKAYTTGPFNIPAPCKIRARITGSPPIERTMTATNGGAGMHGQIEPVLSRETGASVDSFSVVLGVGKTEAVQEIDVKYPAMLSLSFTPALHTGQAGGYQYAGQSYQGIVEVIELLDEGMATFGTTLSAGDRVRVDGQAPATVQLRDGTTVLIYWGSEVAFAQGEGGGIRATLERGGNGGMRITNAGPNFEAAYGDKVFKPKGTDFLVDTSGLKVVDGAVEIIDDASGELVVVSAGQQMNLSNGQLSDFDTALIPPFTTGSGLPVSADFFDPREEPYGAKPLIVENGSVAGGWLLVDPPARHSLKGVTWEKTPRVEMAIAEEGALRLTVPVGSAVAGNDTAPRLLHKVTGDFDLEADVRIEEGSGNPVSASFVVLAPGTGIGVRKKQVEWGKPAVDVWRLPPCVTRLAAGGPFQLPVFNDSGLLSRYDWPEVTEGSARVRLSRRSDMWRAAWSLDGITWNTHTLDRIDLPATLYAGWAFEHTQSASTEPAIFTVTDIRLETSPARSMDIPAWSTFAVNGSVQTQDTSVHLSLDGQSPGTARALSGEMLAGDFDTIVRFDATPWQHQPGELRRWSIAAMTPDQQEAIAIGCIVREDGQRYWAHRSKGFEGVVYLLQSGPVEQPQGKLRLVREKGVVSAYYWDGEDWHQTSYGEQTQFEGPLFLRLEAFNGRANATHPWAPLSVDFTVEQIVSPVAAASLVSVAEPQAVSAGGEGGEVIVSEAQVGGRLSPMEDAVTPEPTAERWVQPTPEPLVSLAEEPGILEFTASPAEAEAGQIVTLSWQTRGGQPYLYRVDGSTQVQLEGSGLLPPAGSLVTAVVGPAGGAATYALGVLDVQSNQWLATAVCEVKVALPPPPPPLPIVPAQPVDPYQPPSIETQPQPQPVLQPVPGAYTVIFAIGADGRPAGYVVDKAGRRFDTRGDVLTIGGPELKPDAGDRIVLKTDAPRFSLLFDCGRSPDGYSPCDFTADSPAGLPAEVVCQVRDRAGYFNISGPDNWAGERHDFPGQRYPADPVLRIVFGSNW